MYSLRNRPGKLAEGSLFCLFLKLVQINFMLTDNVRILYIYLHGLLFLSFSWSWLDEISQTWCLTINQLINQAIANIIIKHQQKNKIRKKYKTIKNAKNECRPCNWWNMNCLSFQSTLVFGRRLGPVPSHSSTNWSTLLTLSLCRSSRVPILSPLQKGQNLSIWLAAGLIWGRAHDSSLLTHMIWKSCWTPVYVNKHTRTLYNQMGA